RRRPSRDRRADPALFGPFALGRPARRLYEEGRPRRRYRRKEEYLLPSRRGVRARARERRERDRHVQQDPRARSGRLAGALALGRALRARAELAGAALRIDARERDDERSGGGDQLPVPNRGALREAPRRRAALGRALSRDFAAA